ncbi:hypothetical protein [Xanthocytophaga agilis]|uniref:Uncharacterized protein n=1 Tax=Xanthocytophaga agilis TaxID=3048010 RepID=A0AAE3QZ38_9BACT|nr:hypothetical protein [Xanthocytophaga agilis]MDJ1500699.1 hypothetical protein [Xanthocytophaga agilis]
MKKIWSTEGWKALLARKYKLDVLQYVIFLSDSKPRMRTQLILTDLVFSFQLVQFSTIDYELFLSSEKGDEVVFAVLGKFGDSKPEQVARRIYERLQQTSVSQMELDKHLHNYGYWLTCVN